MIMEQKDPTMSPYYYVYRVGNKFPTLKHQTLTSAVTEAERLSNQHPGETFEILQCLAITRTVMAKTFWLDGLVIPLQNAEMERGTR
jgi:hypothetical protein